LRGCSYRVVRLAPQAVNLQLFWKDPAGRRYGDFAALAAELPKKRQRLVFAANAGIFDSEHRPLGLHVENRRELRPLNQDSGEGNFFLKPNGVFYLTDDRLAGVTETAQYSTRRPNVVLAVQSGPMLLRNGKPHSAFAADSLNRRIRSGVGVDRAGNVVFLLSRQPVTFMDMAGAFVLLDCPDALYLDGQICQFWLPADGPPPSNGDFAGILGVVEDVHSP
jgi:uncharacterized protein YigE (DUF2233 family)